MVCNQPVIRGDGMNSLGPGQIPAGRLETICAQLISVLLVCRLPPATVHELLSTDADQQRARRSEDRDMAEVGRAAHCAPPSGSCTGYTEHRQQSGWDSGIAELTALST